VGWECAKPQPCTVLYSTVVDSRETQLMHEAEKQAMLHQGPKHTLPWIPIRTSCPVPQIPSKFPFKPVFRPPLTELAIHRLCLIGRPLRPLQYALFVLSALFAPCCPFPRVLIRPNAQPLRLNLQHANRRPQRC